MEFRNFFSGRSIAGLLMLFLTVSVLLPAASAVSVDHPALLFHSITETPGYQYSNLQPWKNYRQQIINNANVALKKQFSENLGAYDRVFYRADYARDAGFAYQITGDTRYSRKAAEALLNLDKGTVSTKTDNALALGSYSLAYDLIQPTMSAENDTQIRDKLALLADSVYQSLNDGGKNTRYVSFADFHGQAYPMMGIAGAALADYANPNHLSLTSSPADWTKVGTDYLFENDQLHSYGRSLFSFGFDEVSGKHLNGAYKSYVITDYAWWLQIYNHVYNENPFEKYPAAKKAFTSELWESLPNGYGNDYVTSGNLKWTYHRDFVSLLNDTEKSEILNFDETVENSSLLPYSTSLGGAVPAGLLYCVFGNYNALPRTVPAQTSHFDPTAIYQVFRGGWDPDADWMSVVTWNAMSNSNRDMAHMDQASIEYYSRGDLLLSDAGENKYVLDKVYGEYEIHHNSVAIEDPRSPFSLSSWAGSPARGIYKGNANELVTPVQVPAVIQTPWMQGIDIHATIRQVIGDSFTTGTTLSSPVSYTRTILYPDTEYFVVIDRFEGTEPWTYSTIFRPASQSITPSVMQADHSVAPGDVGHVNGVLNIGNTVVDWVSQPYKTEQNAGITADRISWTTHNPFGRDVNLDIVSVPSSTVYLNKIVGRIAGYDARAEVFSPVVRLSASTSKDLYRITALLSRYSSEEQKNATEIPVQGNGHALKIQSSSSEDIIYAGSGQASFGSYSTDADIVFIRNTDNRTEATLVGGSYLDDREQTLIRTSRVTDYVTVRKNGNSVDYRTDAAIGTEITVFDTSKKATANMTSPPPSGKVTSVPAESDGSPSIVSVFLSLFGL